MKKFVILALVIGLAFAFGCSSAVKMAPASDETPSWVNGPPTFEKEGYVYAVGSSGPVKNIGFARTFAETNGRAALLRFLESGPVINGQKYTEADQTMVEVPAFWRNNKTGVTHVLVRCQLPKK